MLPESASKDLEVQKNFQNLARIFVVAEIHNCLRNGTDSEYRPSTKVMHISIIEIKSEPANVVLPFKLFLTFAYGYENLVYIRPIEYNK